LKRSDPQGRLDVPLPHGPDFFQFSDGRKMQAALAEMEFFDLSPARKSIKHGSSSARAI